jgi:hypothetical protein
MSLLDTLRNIPKALGRNLEKNIGGLLGEDLKKLSDEERSAIRRQAAMAVFDAMARGTTPTAGLERVAAMANARLDQRSARERQAAAEAMLPDISSRILGGRTGTMIEDVEGGPATPLMARRTASEAGAREALGLMYGTQAGRDIAAGMPDLAKLAQEGMAGRTVGGTVYNPLTGQFTRPPEEKGPKKRVGSEDLGDRVITYFDDGTTSINMKGLAPKSEDAGRPDLSKDERDRIYKARDTITSSSEVIAGLTEARRLSDIAFAGPLAGLRATGGAALPGRLEPAGAQETIEFDTLIKQQVLPQLKIIFGGNPTEGERKILLDLQGSSSMPREVRNRILDRAIEAANRRMQSSQAEVEDILSGTYFKPSSMSGGAAPAVPASMAPAAPKADFVWRNGKLVPAK